MQSPPATRRGNPAAGAIKRSFVALASVTAITVLIALVYQAMGGYTTQKTATPGSTIVAPAVPVLDGMAGWHTSIAATTCGDYAHSMTSAQRLAAAEWLLAIDRRVEVTDATDGAEFAGTFAVEITTACTKYYGTDPTTGVIAAAVMAYMDDPSLHPAHH